MTVETEVTRVIVAGNAVTTAFSFSFPIPGSSATDQTNAELLLFGTDSSITVLADNLWSITGVDTGVGGTFTYPLSGSPVTTGAFLILSRIVPYLQDTTLSAQGAYSPAVVEAALDNLAFQTEQLNTWRLQSIRAPITDAALADLPTKAFRAGAFLKFDSNGDPSTASSTTGLAGSILVGTNSTSSTLTTDLLLTGSAVTSVVTVSGVTTVTLTGGTTNPGGSSGQVQYNNSGAFGGLTAAQLTADVSAMVGDSGSGGTKGSAPAPAAGDAAALKFLKADGTWAVTPSTTSGIPAPTAAGSTKAITSAMSGGVINLDTASGSVCTLPAATGSGARFTFYVTVVATTNAHIVKVHNHGELIKGSINTNTSARSADGQYQSNNSTFDTVTLNGTSSGGSYIGDYVILDDVATGVWMVRGLITTVAPAASPFSQTV